MEQRYLGDGVYASFDGYQIWLARDHHSNKVVALEAPVMAALERYAADLREYLAEKRRQEGGGGAETPVQPSGGAEDSKESS